MTKYELVLDDTIKTDSETLYHVRALKDFGDICAGDLGGYIKGEHNLSHGGDARVYGDARVCGDAWVDGNAWVGSKADYTVVQGFGTAHRATTFYKTQDRGIAVKCGCFSGTLDEFREQVKNTRDGKIAKEYLALADLMEMHFEEE